MWTAHRIKNLEKTGGIAVTEADAATDFAPKKGLSAYAIDTLVDRILAAATLDEKVTMMSGRGFFALRKASNRRWGADPYPAGSGIARLNVPMLYFTDGPRGVARGHSTCFPCTMARGATFDPALEHRVGEVIAIEARAQGCTLSGAVCINLLRHPAWGRAQETYGEDSHHLGEMGAALARGLQTHNVMATVKHFALNSMENARFTVDVEIDERSLHEVYLPHFKRVLDAGCASVMSAYNKVNGEYCGQNRYLLTDILRGEWGFTGFVHSDWIMGVRAIYGAAAGLDIENPEPLVFGDKLRAAVEAGTVEPEVIDRACRRILTTQYRFACAEDPLPAYPIELVASSAHLALAQEVAEKSAVLLKNDALLPIKHDQVKSIAVIGRLAAIENTGDNGSSRVRPPFVVTPLAGLQVALGSDRIIVADENDLDAVTQATAQADVAVVVVGYTAVEEGEFIPGGFDLGASSDATRLPGPTTERAPIGGDRDVLTLPPDQVAMIHAAQASGTPVIVVIVAGSAVLVEGWHEQAGAILQTFYSGMAGGTALARLLLGEVSPSGKLPFTVAHRTDDYPFFDKTAGHITYDRYHGYSLFERDDKKPRYGFGHGLSYTTFGYRALRTRADHMSVHVQVSVTNQGACAAEEVVQVYIGFPGIVVDRPKKRLHAFQRVALAPGETRTLHLTIARNDLRWRNPHTHDWAFESGTYRIYVGGSLELAGQHSVEIVL